VKIPVTTGFFALFLLQKNPSTKTEMNRIFKKPLKQALNSPDTFSHPLTIAKADGKRKGEKP